MIVRRNHGVPLLALLVAVVASCVAAVTTPHATGASSGTVVGATIPSATSLTTTACQALVPGRTDFGVVQPGTSAVTTLDCEVVFGSSNDTATLRAFQLDGTGYAMAAMPDAIDTSFGVNGWRDVGACGTYQFVDLAVRADGWIYAVGSCSGAGIDMLVARFSPDGTLDTAGFNAPNGYLRVAAGPGNDNGLGIALEPDGDAVIVGTASNGTNDDIAVARVKSNGTLDTAGFAAPNGYMRVDLGVGHDRGAGVAVQADGKIVFAGHARLASGNDAFVGRLNTNGTLDTTTFNSPTGYRTIDVSTTAADDQVNDLLLDSQERILLTGMSQNPAVYSATVVRVLADGAPDPAFGAPNGFVRVNLPSYHDDANSIGELPGGDLLVGGGVGTSGSAFVFRLTAAGALVTSFGAPNGWVLLPPFNSYTSIDATEVLPQRDGTAYVTGRLVSNGMFVGRISATGWDTTFGGGDGIVTSSLEDENMGAVMQGHKVLLAGDFGGNRPSIARFGGPEITDYASLGGGGDTDWASAGTTNMFATCVREIVGAATAHWLVDPDADCTAGDGDPWNAIPATSVPASRVASTTVSGTTGVTVRLRFGVRMRSDQRPGLYQAGIVFETVAPAT